ncbi:MAG: glycine cleavage system protein GcvH [Actinomycetia bacterium]|nr:glycine cleavage system protein GcvH [Actinomycetes bacterium]
MAETQTEIPEHLSYTTEHEWVQTGDGKARLGITDYAQDALGDVVYAQLPREGDEVSEGEIIAELESTKSVGEIYAPFDGVVVAVNEELEDQPELVNRDPYGEGWIVDLSLDSPLPSTLLDAAGYRDLIS